MIYVLSCSNKKNKLILCSWVCLIITLVWHSRLLVCMCLWLLDAAVCLERLHVSQFPCTKRLQMYSGVKHEPHETGVICSEKLLLDSALNFTSTPRLFSTRGNVWMYSPNLYPDRGEKKNEKMREKASNKAARGYRRGLGNVKKKKKKSSA